MSAETGSKKRPLNVCLIGTGYMGKCHALAWNAVASTFEDVERPRLELLVEVDAERARKRAGEFGFGRFSGDWKSAVADPGIDVISIASPTWLHAEMAIAALEQGKHVWCEKPMSLDLASSTNMSKAAQGAPGITALGYNYIQNPAIRLIKRLVDEGELGEINHVRVEMDEDFMADPNSPYDAFNSGPQAGGALEEFGVHPLSLVQTVVGNVSDGLAAEWKPYESRKGADGAAVLISTFDIAGALFRLDNGASGIFAVNRSAWGRKGRIVLQLFGSKGSIYYDQERLNEVMFYSSADKADRQGYRTILSGPHHPPYSKFVPTPGHSLGFNDLKVIECREVIRAIRGDAAHLINFEAGLKIEQSIAAFSRSIETKQWERVQR